MTRPQTKARKRAARCYELSFKSLVEMGEPGDWRLVHGLVGSADTGHAWLTDGKEVFDPVHGKTLGSEFLPVGTYQNLSHARQMVTYTKAEAVAKLLAAEHYGPWHDD